LVYKSKLADTEVAGVSNPESWFALFGLSLSDYLIFIRPLCSRPDVCEQFISVKKEY